MRCQFHSRSFFVGGIFFKVFAPVTILFLLAGSLSAAEYPTREIKLIVPISPGGGVDTVARIFSEKVEKILGVSIVVVNNAAGGGAVGAHMVAQAKPDGYTLLNGYTGLIIMKPLLTPDVPYRPTDFTPICRTVGMPVAIFVQNDAPWKTLKDLADYARKNPGKLRASVGPAGGFLQTLTDLFKVEAQVDFADIPTKGGVTQSAALMGGHVELCTDSITPGINFVKAGRLRILACTHKLPGFPDVKTFAETGFPGVNLKLWHAILAPKGIQKPIVTRISQAYEAASKDPSVEKKLADLFILPDYLNPEETARFIENEVETTRMVLKKTGMIK